jgi:hypothetical protein
MTLFRISIENVERQELGPSINAALTTKSFRCSIPRPHLFNSIETSCCLETSHTQSKRINTLCITQRTNAPMPSFWAAQIALIGRPCCSLSGPTDTRSGQIGQKTRLLRMGTMGIELIIVPGARLILRLVKVELAVRKSYFGFSKQHQRLETVRSPSKSAKSYGNVNN